PTCLAPCPTREPRRWPTRRCLTFSSWRVPAWKRCARTRPSSRGSTPTAANSLTRPSVRLSTYRSSTPPLRSAQPRQRFPDQRLRAVVRAVGGQLRHHALHLALSVAERQQRSYGVFARARQRAASRARLGTGQQRVGQPVAQLQHYALSRALAYPGRGREEPGVLVAHRRGDERHGQGGEHAERHLWTHAGHVQQAPEHRYLIGIMEPVKRGLLVAHDELRTQHDRLP